jgi:hypothetical protein
MQFLAGLEFTLHNGLPQEKLTTIRQCAQKVEIHKSSKQIKLNLLTVPAINLPYTKELTVTI